MLTHSTSDFSSMKTPQKLPLQFSRSGNLRSPSLVGSGRLESPNVCCLASSSQQQQVSTPASKDMSTPGKPTLPSGTGKGVSPSPSTRRSLERSWSGSLSPYKPLRASTQRGGGAQVSQEPEPVPVVHSAAYLSSQQQRYSIVVSDSGTPEGWSCSKWPPTQMKPHIANSHTLLAAHVGP